MSTKIGHFEILSELAKSPTGAVYKANDPEGQTIALKAIELRAFGESATALEQALLREVESSKPLNSSHITPILGAGEMEGKFCATMQYVQGNSIATMLARKEGFSIWDLLDIGRQVCNGLDYAHSNKVYHYSLEPAKIMCGWDGMVKILAYGVSSAGRFAQQISAGVPAFLHYMSPEQIRGEEIDGRANLFSLGAMFYEMVTDRRPFVGNDVQSLRQSILESIPAPPMHLNPKLHPLLSDLIMRALQKDPAKRYQRGRQLLDDLENCKESKPQLAAKPAPSKGPVVPDKIKAAVQAKFIGTAPPKPAASGPVNLPAPVRRPQPRVSAPVEKKIAMPQAQAPTKAAAAAAGWSGAEAASASTPEFDASSDVISSSTDTGIDGAEAQSAYMSAGAAPAAELETFDPAAPKVAVDPLMAEDGPSGGSGTSFSEISELPPLKEVHMAPAPPPEPPPVEAKPSKATMYRGKAAEPEKLKIQPREVAQKAIKEIQSVPPRMMLYSMGGAVALILVIVVGMWLHYSSSSDDDTGASRSNTPAQQATQPAPAQPAPQTEAANPPRPATAAAPDTTASEAAAEPAQPEEEPATEAMAPARLKGKSTRRKAAAAIVPGRLTLDSTPQGAQVQIDGQSDPGWVTPVELSNLQPGSHSITVSKAGYSTDTRSIDVGSGSRSMLVVHLTQVMAALSVGSVPAGANVYVDGKDTGKITPARVSLEKGTHVVLVRKMGYIDETTTAQFALGQTVSISPTLRPLGNVDSIRTVGKMKKLFRKGGSEGQGAISIHTQPKGAQVAINQRILDKNSPVDAMLDPGNYEIDITLSGYAPIHKVVTIDNGGKVVVDEILQRQ